MSHGVHAVQHEVEHELEHDEHGGGHGHGDSKDFNKKVALLISVLALFLAFSETLGKSAQTAALNSQIEASNLWNFFQAKNIRRTSTLIAAEQTQARPLPPRPTPTQKAAIEKQIDDWNKTAARYRSEPEAAGGKGEGTVELSRRAIEEQHHRDEYLAKYHHYEFASAAFQIGIVLASATVITGMVALSLLAGGLGVIGLAFMAFGLIAPHVLHSALSGRSRLPRAARMRRRMRHSSRNARPALSRRASMRSSLSNPALDRGDEAMRPIEPDQDVLVEPAEPAESAEACGCVTSKMKAVTATRRAWRTTSTPPAAIQYLWASSQSPSTLSGNSVTTGTTNTMSVAAGGSFRMMPASRALTARSGSQATIHSTIGSR